MKYSVDSQKAIARELRGVQEAVMSTFSTRGLFKQPEYRSKLRAVIRKRLPGKEVNLVYPYALAAFEESADEHVLKECLNRSAEADIQQRKTGLFLSDIDIDGSFPKEKAWATCYSSPHSQYVEAIAHEVLKLCKCVWSDEHKEILVKLLFSTFRGYSDSSYKLPETLQFAIMLEEFAEKMIEYQTKCAESSVSSDLFYTFSQA